MIREVESADDLGDNLVGPVIRAGDLADAVIDAVAADNPKTDVIVLDRGDYIRIHTERECRLTRNSLEKFLGRTFNLAHLEAEMPAFKGQLQSRVDEMRWFYTT